jgi:hypothetical protein
MNDILELDYDTLRCIQKCIHVRQTYAPPDEVHISAFNRDVICIHMGVMMSLSSDQATGGNEPSLRAHEPSQP